MSEPSTTPPVPPVEPAPPVPPVPQYGEYAPAGYVPPTQPVAGPPVTGAPQPYGAASYPQQQRAGRQRKTWDLVLTIVLLALGFFGMLIGLLYTGIFADPALMDQVAQGAGLPGFSGEVGNAGAVIGVSHVLLYLLALGGSLPLLLTKRVAFWAPLTAGVIAAIIFWGTFVAVFLSDPAFVSTVS